MFHLLYFPCIYLLAVTAMTFPSSADADPDPTTQIPWPARPTHRRRASTINHPGSIAGSSTAIDDALGTAGKRVASPGKGDGAVKRRMSTWDLVKLSISMAGAQIAWTVELGCVVTLTSECNQLICACADMEHRSCCPSDFPNNSLVWCGSRALSAD